MLLTEHPVPLLQGHLQPNIVYPTLHLRGLVRTQEFLLKKHTLRHEPGFGYCHQRSIGRMGLDLSKCNPYDLSGINLSLSLVYSALMQVSVMIRESLSLTVLAGEKFILKLFNQKSIIAPKLRRVNNLPQHF
jgi:hypothetical protein